MAARLSSYLQLRPSRLPAAETANGYVWLNHSACIRPSVRPGFISTALLISRSRNSKSGRQLSEHHRQSIRETHQSQAAADLRVG